MATSSGSSFRPFVRSLPVVGIAVLALPFVSGCELFVHFDRSRIGGDSGAVDGGPDGGGTDGGTDGGSMDANVDSGATDTGVDAFVTPDVGNDAFHFDTGGEDAGCQGISDCPASTDECVVPTCTAGLCGTMNLGATHVLSTGQTPNDCQQVVCNPAGGTMTIADATDPPPSNACEAVTCSGTTVVRVPASAGTTCAFGGGSVCDGAGACVECNASADCAATGSECVVATCVAHACGTMNLGTGHTLSTGQTAHDCQRIVCNGSGGTTSVDDASDTPVATSVCLTSPACTGSPLAPSFTSAATGTDCTADGVAPRHVCGDTTMPTFAGQCVECNVDTDCSGAATCQANHTCA